MRGTHRVRSPFARLVAVATAAAALSAAGWFSPASAHVATDARAQRRHIIDRALSQIGTPYSYGSESPRSGFDCSGLMYWAFKNHGDTLPRSSSDMWRLRKKNAYKRVWSKKNLHKGDLLFFNTSGGGVSHVGMYIGNKKMVHSGSGGGRVRRDYITESYYRARYVGAVRVPVLRR